MGYIYKVTNNINGKCYIGQTTKEIDKRWYFHVYNAINMVDDFYFHKAIRKYGFENFLVEEIEKCENKDLDNREQYWIKYYDTFNNGYNLTLGGGGIRRTDIDLIRSLWDEGLSISKIQKKIKGSRTAIYEALIDYKNYSTQESNRRGAIKRGVLMCDKNGNIIKEFNSIIEAQRETGLTHIGECCRNHRKSDGGFIWKYKEEVVDGVLKVCHGKSVRCVETGIIYSSITNAEKVLNIQHISDCCRGVRKTAGGYHWEYVEKI